MSKQKLNYKHYLLSEHWKSFRKEIIRKRKTCEHCGTDRTLNVHHLHYNTVGREQDWDVLLLCRICHKTVHGLKIKKKRNKSKSYKKAKKNLKCKVCGLPRGYMSVNGYYIGGRKRMCLPCFNRYGSVENYRQKFGFTRKREFLTNIKVGDKILFGGHKKRTEQLKRELDDGFERAIKKD